MSEGQEQLQTYQERRHFERTPEPRGQVKPPNRQPIYVVQKHNASTLHYDFRLEVAGVLKSWAVPKGPAMDPKIKRLAIPTEDHPLEYAKFEGTIPEGEYGAGSVEIWDSGIFQNLKFRDGSEVPAEQAIKEGHITFHLEGKKLKGNFALTRTGSGKEERWLLVKMSQD